VRLIRDGVKALLAEQSLALSSVRAIAAGAPGITDPSEGVVIATSYLMGWQNVPLRALLEEAIGVPAAVDNDVNLAALGESLAGAAKGVDNFVFVAIGTGIGAGIILNGQLFHGNGWSAGEIGYMLVPGTSEQPTERHKPGALEEVAGGEGAKAQWRSRWDATKTSLSRDALASEIFDHALDGNPLAQEVLELSARTLAYAIYNIWLVLNCDLFVLGGSVGLHPALRDAAHRILATRSIRIEPRLISSSLGSDAQLMGAIFLAIETAKTRFLVTTP
jgi:glucokinase